MKIVAKTDIGLQRTENQDNYRAGRQPDGTVWALVCDGMGGANGGGLASETAVELLEKVFLEKLPLLTNEEEMMQLMQDGLQQANTEIHALAVADPGKKGMGTTIVCVIIKNNRLLYAHVGDSRIYLRTNDEITQLTKDHSMVQEMVEQGTITEQEAQRHPRKNLITRALGVLPQVNIDKAIRDIAEGEELLLCTDGLSNYVPPETMVQVMQITPFFEQADSLVSLALSAGGQDNITALLVLNENTEEVNG